MDGKGRKSAGRELGSKYFGRSVKKWRLIANLSQEELAERARISLTLMGAVERERGHISMEVLCNLCLGLASELGRPMLESLFSDSLAAMWKDSVATEARLCEERGLPVASYERTSVSEDTMAEVTDEAYRAFRKWSLLWFRTLGKGGGQEWCMSDTNEFAPQAPPHGADTGRIRVRKAKAALVK